MKFYEYVKKYLSHVSENCSQSTINTYEYKLNTISKFLGDVDCCRLDTSEAQRFIIELETKYKSKTVSDLYDIVNSVFKMAVSEGYINSNPFEQITVRRAVCHQAIALDDVGLHSFVTKAEGNPSLYIPILIAAETGLKRSQILALTWGDVDFSKAYITVPNEDCYRRKYAKVNTKEYQWYKVQMSSHLSEVLLEVKNYRRSISVGVEDEDYVCLTCTYKVMKPTYFDKLFRTFVHNIEGFPTKFRFHDLRWSFIRSEIERGTDPMIVADKVGHKSCIFVLDYYYRYHNSVA